MNDGEIKLNTNELSENNEGVLEAVTCNSELNQTDNNLTNNSNDNNWGEISNEQLEAEPNVKVKKQDIFTKLYNISPNFIKKTCDFISKNWLYFSVPILIFALFMGVLYSLQIFPFGTDCMSQYDLISQIVPFLEHIYDIIDGKSSMFYSPAVMGGVDVFGTLAYCAISPFTFIFLFFGRTTVYYAVSFVLPLKLTCVAFSAIYFFKKTFKNIPEYQILLISILYAYCGYMFVANTYINWVDFLIYMPFVILGFKNLLETKKIWYFGISYALLIYTCFSIACFALLLVYLILVAYAIIMSEGKERWQVLSRICFSLVFAISVSLPIIVPALRAYMVSARNTGLFENIQNEITPDHLYAKTTYLVSDTLFLFLTFIYFIKTGFKTRKNIFLLVTAILLLFPVFIDEVCNLMNAGSYMSYALRFGFLNAVYFLYVAGLLLNSLKENEKVNKAVNWSFTGIFVACAVFVVWEIVKLNNDMFDNVYPDAAGSLDHSTGALEVVGQVCLIIGSIVLLGMMLYKFRLMTLKNISFVLIACLSVQVAFYNIQLVQGNIFNPTRWRQYSAIVNDIQKTEEVDIKRYYRIKDNNAAMTNVAQLSLHTNSYSVFSSVIDAKNFIATDLFDYDGNSVNSVNSSGGMYLGDCFLGYKYFFVQEEKDSPVTFTGKPDIEVMENTRQANFVAYINKYVYPNSYTINESDYINSNYLKIEDEDPDSFYNLGVFLGEPELVKNYRYTDDFDLLNENIAAGYMYLMYDKELDYYTVALPLDYEGAYYFDLDFPEDYKIETNQNAVNSAFNKYSMRFSEEKRTSIKLGYNQKSVGNSFWLHIKSTGDKKLNSDDVAKYVKGCVVRTDKVQSLAETLRQRECEYWQEGGKFTVKANAQNDDTYVFLNYVAIDGFSAKVNGKDVELSDNGMGYMLVKLEKGENTVVISYSSPYVKYFCLGCFISLLLIIALYLACKKYPQIMKKMTPIVSVLAILLACAVFSFFIGYPTVEFLKKAVKMIIAKIKLI